MDLRANLDQVAAEIKRRYPERFENPRRTAPNGVGRPTGDRGRTGKPGRTFADLPPEAQAAADKFVRTIPPDRNGKKYTREDYLATYEWDS